MPNANNPGRFRSRLFWIQFLASQCTTRAEAQALITEAQVMNAVLEHKPSEEL